MTDVPASVDCPHCGEQFSPSWTKECPMQGCSWRWTGGETTERGTSNDGAGKSFRERVEEIRRERARQKS